LNKILFTSLCNNSLSFLRKVRYYFYLKFKYFLDNYGLSLDNYFRNINELEISEVRKDLKTNINVLKKFSFQNKPGSTEFEADKILRHHFNLLGHIYFPNQILKSKASYQYIDWHYDPSTDTNFPKDIWYRLITKIKPKNADPKYPWELSRFNHLILLGKAYGYSEDENYSKEFINQILDWIQNNPVRYGINWSNTMEVGIRIANWSFAILFFSKSDTLTDTFYSIYINSCKQHAQHIMKNLENLQPYTSNHYIGNLYGLFILSSIIPSIDEGNRWNFFSKSKLENEILKQTDEEGWGYEGSTAYHKLITEMFLFSYVIADYVGQPFSKRFKIRLIKMIDVLNTIKKPDNKIPQIGDNDSGSSFIFNFQKDNLDLTTLFIIAEKYNLLKRKTSTAIINYQDIGYYFYQNKQLYLLMTSGPKKLLGLGSHAHNDILHYILNINGFDILIDPGSFVYSSNPQRRNDFRSINYHNSLSWEGLEPRDLNKGLFIMKDRGSRITSEIKKEASSLNFFGKYIYKGFYHKRSMKISLDKNFLKVVDTASAPGAHLSFNFAPNIIPRIRSNIIKTDYANFHFSGISNFELQKTNFSKGYGKIQDNYVIKAKLSGLTSEHTITWK
jgi:hypothetical protein